MNEFRVSVIIPVYKAERFVEKAVISALEQPETDEVLLIEDGSPDGSYEVCKRLFERFPGKIRLLTHEGGTNKGAAVTRNTGITNARNEFLAFLDADDYFLPGRFEVAKKLLLSDKNIDGVYEAIGTHAYDDEGKAWHEKRMAETQTAGLPYDLTSMTEAVAPEKLFEVLILGKKGWFHFDGITLRKTAIEKTGLLDTRLSVGEDTDFFYRLSIEASLVPGRLHEPVAMRGVYRDNATLSIYTNIERLKRDHSCNSRIYKKIFDHMLSSEYDKAFNRFILMRYLDHYDVGFLLLRNSIKRKFLKAVNLLKVITRYPRVISKVI